jgi:hypothetical protein
VILTTTGAEIETTVTADATAVMIEGAIVAVNDAASAVAPVAEILGAPADPVAEIPGPEADPAVEETLGAAVTRGLDAAVPAAEILGLAAVQAAVAILGLAGRVVVEIPGPAAVSVDLLGAALVVPASADQAHRAAMAVVVTAAARAAVVTVVAAMVTAGERIGATGTNPSQTTTATPRKVNPRKNPRKKSQRKKGPRKKATTPADASLLAMPKA